MSQRWKRMPTCLQRDTCDCGIVCLQAIILYHGVYLNLETIRKAAFLSNTGTRLSDLKLAAVSFHLQTNCYEMSLKALLASFKSPCILHWNQNHYVVLYRITKRRGKFFYHIMDPGVGKIKLNQDTFEKGWLNVPEYKSGYKAGVIIQLEPKEAFSTLESETPSRTSDFREVISYFLKYKKAIFYIVVCVLGANILQFALPFMAQNIIDVGIELRSKVIIKAILIGQALLYISSGCFEFIRRWLLLHVNSRVNIILVSDFLLKPGRLPMRFFESKVIGDLLQRINDHTKIEYFLTSIMTDIIFSLSTLIMFSIVLFLYSVEIFLFFFLFSLLYVFWIYLFLGKRKQIDYSRFLYLSANSSNLIEFIEGMKDIKLYNSHHKKRWQWENIQIQLFNLNTKSLTIEQYQNVGSLLINQIKNILLTFMSAAMVIDGNLTLGMMLSIQFIIGQLEGPINRTIGYMHSWQDAKISFDRMAEIHKLENEDHDGKYKLPVSKSYDITIHNLCFRYGSPFSPWVLKDINLVIPSGKTTAIVGMSGSGKTTLVKLLLGFYLPTQGEIRVGNYNLEAINIQSWRNLCSVIMQDSFVFNDTIENNINLTEEKTDYQRMKFCCESANFQEVVDALPNKYNTKIGLDGNGLSNGQIQRLLIARAIYKDSDYIFFDEFTNSLDAQNEANIMDSLNKIKTGKTAIIIAHRFSTIKNADQIVVIDQGKVVEIGKHDELINNRGIYYRLMKEQLNLHE
ncbi:MAG: peptidase domain-containing ABC transporter [Bacteroides sp.]|nr:peptidase domain-containing ABC transporter [Bacteroides sp.]